MASIITVTVNPCIDISAHVPKMIPDRKLKCSAVKKEPGGGGINVSRVIKRLGGNTMAVYLAGGYTGDFFNTMLHSENVATRVIKIEQHTRENFVVAEESTHLQYRLGMPGPQVNEKEWQQCLYEIAGLQDMDYIVASGSLTGGMPVDFFARVAAIAKQKSARMVLDTSGEPLRAALQEGLFMIKPNLGELAFLAGLKELDREAAIATCREIISTKQCEVAVVSMAAAGAMMITDKMEETVCPPLVEIRSNVGAGDSMVAGVVYSLSKNRSLKEALQYGVACGTAATMNEGTALCDIVDVDRLMELIRASK